MLASKVEHSLLWWMSEYYIWYIVLILCLIVHFPWLSGNVPRLPSHGVYISHLVRFARCCTSVSDFYSKNLPITSKLLTQGYIYHKLRKRFAKFFMSYSKLLSKFGGNIVSRICFGNNMSPGLLRWSSVQTQEGQMPSISSRRAQK